MANEEVELCVEIGSNIGDTWLEKADLNQLCRACANAHENMIPIFDGDGLEHDLQAKIDKHFPVNISKDDGLPHQMCLQCASTLVAWHDMFTGCIDAEKKLKNLLNKSKDEEQVEDKVAGSSVVSEDSATEMSKSQRKMGSEMEIDDDDEEDDDIDEEDDDDDYVPDNGDDDDNDDEEEELETKDVVLHKLDAKEKEKTVEINEKGTTIRDQCLKTSSASVSQTKPERKACSVDSDDSLKKCMKKCLKINVACECGKQITKQVSLLLHVKKMHTLINAYTCTKCNDGFNCYLKYKMHVEQKHPECAVDSEDSCLIQSRNKSITKRQLQESSTFLASLCAEEDPSTNCGDDSNHEVDDGTHSNDNSNNEEENITHEEKSSRINRQYVRKDYTTCSICSAQCRTTLSLLRHWKEQHSTEEAKSDPKYLKYNNMHSCNICDEFYSDVRSLKKHKKDAHGIDHVYSFTEEEEEQLKQAEKILANSGLKTYHCTFCDMVIANGRRYLSHIAKHKGQLPFCCEFCGKTFAKKISLRTHVKIIHEGLKEYKCEFCGKEFGHRTNMLSHQRTMHTGERRYSCKICGLTFVTANTLYFHQRSHTNYKPHQCEECNINYSRRRQLVDHINRHHRSEKDFVCEICGKAFAVRSSLLIHMVTHSEARPYKCSTCERDFKRKKYLNRHIAAYHSLNKELYNAILQ